MLGTRAEGNARNVEIDDIDNWLVHLVNNKGAAARPCETLYHFSSRLLRWRSTSVASSRLSPPSRYTPRMLSLVVTRFCLPENILENVPLLVISRGVSSESRKNPYNNNKGMGRRGRKAQKVLVSRHRWGERP